MLKFFVQQFLRLALTLLGVSFVSFMILRLVPGDPVLLLLGERGASPEVMAQMRSDLGLDRPLLIQYGSFLKGAIQGDLGSSLVTKKAVWEEFRELFPATLELGLLALIVAVVFGIPLGMLAAAYRQRLPDTLLMSTSLVGYSMPIFWWGLILILFFSVNLGLTPVSGRISFLYDVEAITGLMLIDSLHPTVLREEGLSAFYSALHHLVLPVMALATIPLAVIARMTRASMLDVLFEDYIRTARAKGVAPARVICHHALRNALIPITTVIGLLLGSMITGAILTETLFAWPGVGRWLVSSINARDYPVIQGAILLLASFIVILNSLIDGLYRLINPRLRS
jgi:dipeptide transport system permease protein